MKPVYIVLDGFDSLMAGNTSGLDLIIFLFFYFQILIEFMKKKKKNRFLKWLPVSFPTNTRVILTSSPTGAIEKLIKKHCWEKFEVV